jgi:hypothetical protein
MTPEAFRASLADTDPPQGLAPAVRGLWHDGRGDWESAHRAVQDATDDDSAWVHAYLHRKDGDLWNAAYWYSRSGREPATGPLQEEWATLVAALLAAAGAPGAG